MKRHPYLFWCTFGHYLIAHNASDRGFYRILVLEDDIRFLKDKDKVYSSLACVPENSDWSLLDWWPYFAGDYWKDGSFKRYIGKNAGIPWVKWDSDNRFKLRSSGAYIASKKGIRAIIDIHDAQIPGSIHSNHVGQYRAADEIFDTPLACHFGLSCYISNPVLARQVNLNCHGGGGQDKLYTMAQSAESGFSLENYKWE